MVKILNILAIVRKANNVNFFKSLKGYKKQIIALVAFIIINKIFLFDFDEKTIYLLGIVSVIASCASYGQIVSIKKNEGIYEYNIAVGTSYWIVLIVEFMEFYVVNGLNLLFLSISNSVFWFVIIGKLDFLFMILYLSIIFITSCMFSVLAIQASFLNDNAPYYMSFSILLIITILMILNIDQGITIINMVCLVCNIICLYRCKKRLGDG